MPRSVKSCALDDVARYRGVHISRVAAMNSGSRGGLRVLDNAYGLCSTVRGVNWQITDELF